MGPIPVEPRHLVRMVRRILQRSGLAIVVAWCMLQVVRLILILLFLRSQLPTLEHLVGSFEPLCLEQVATLENAVALAALEFGLFVLNAWEQGLWWPLRRAILKERRYFNVRRVLLEAASRVPMVIGLRVLSQMVSFGALVLAWWLHAPVVFFVVFPLQLVMEATLYFGVAREVRVGEAWQLGLDAVRTNWSMVLATHGGVLLVLMSFVLWLEDMPELHPLVLLAILFGGAVSYLFFKWLVISALHLSLDESLKNRT